jgi:uncharacterized protein (TIGR00297 family)
VQLGLRLAEGIVVSGAVALLARRLEALTSSGAWAAAITGTVLVAGGGWAWLGLVGIFFVTSSFLTRCRPRAQGAASIPSPSTDLAGRRWDQVAANGGVAACAAAIHGLFGSPLAFGAAAGAIATATADTWATELGRWSRTPPRLITTWRSVPHGTSGGITPFGTTAAAAGALLISCAAAVLLPGAAGHPVTVLAAGFSGAMVDSLLGATIEERYPWVSNSVVNLVATAWGAGVVLAAAGGSR